MLTQIFKLFIIIASLIGLSLNATKGNNNFTHNSEKYSKFLRSLLEEQKNRNQNSKKKTKQRTKTRKTPRSAIQTTS